MSSFSLQTTVKIFLFLIGATVILYYGRPFLVPLAFAAILAMLLQPLVEWLQAKNWKKAWSIVVAVLLLLLLLSGIVWLIVWQVSDLANNAQNIEESLMKKVEEAKKMVHESLGISPQKQKEMMQKQSASGGGGIAALLSGMLSGIGSFLTNLLLVMVYLFLFLFFSGHLKEFVLRAIPGDRTKTKKVLFQCREVAHKYLTGMALMIVCLWVMYGIGFTIVGVKNAIFFAILCGLLELVPFVGNLAGNAITVLMSVAQGASMNVVIGILITYAVVQFIQTYLLEPLVVGAEVRINPLFTIAGIVAAELVWGVPGMILVLPFLGILKIIFDNVEPLKPYGFLMGSTKAKAEKK